jgi:2-hydroxychromene-2-carboxylate isomerase
MGELIILADRLRDRGPRVGMARPAFFFDLACPFSYLAAERIERILGEVEWIPVSAATLALGVRQPAPTVDGAARLRAEAERRARELRLALVWPERFPADFPRALRVAAHAAEIGAGARFALAAGRLAFCGGYDLEDSDTLAEAAAAAGIGHDPCLLAAADPGRDEVPCVTAGALRVRGVRALPVIRLGGRFLDAEAALVSPPLAPPA